ncbi:MAG: L,D-transpeptidase family protein [Prolixibacteraceae bacterium]
MHNYILISLLFVFIYFNNEMQDSASPAATNPAKDVKAGVASKKYDIRVDKYYDFSDPKTERTDLEEFYNNRNNKLIWFNYGKYYDLNENGRELLLALEKADDEGLNRDYYHFDKLKSDIERGGAEKDSALYSLAQLDVSLTQSYLDYARDIATGRIHPRHLNVNWEIFPDTFTFHKHLEKAVGRKEIAQSLKNLRPEHQQYDLLLQALKDLKEKKASGEWPVPGTISSIAKNDSTPEVVLVKKRLAASGYLPKQDSAYINSGMYDEKLVTAVKMFQRYHGLEIDGVVGPGTLAEMNKTVDFRIKQVRLNLDRWRWLPNVIGERDIIVNIPGFKLEYYENNKLKQEMKVVVGKTVHYTPALKDTITYLVFNPTWNVPYSIATEEMLPKIKADTSFLSRNNYKLLKGSYDSDQVVNPNSIDWSKITPDNFPFFIVERPGNGNSLGRVKFMLPNNHSIYLHDTPADHLFNRKERAFSHGCVRLEKPFQLAETLLKGQITPHEIDRMLDSFETQTVVLDNPVAVHIVYQTVWVDDFGELNYRKDIYGFDRMSFSLLEKSEEIAPKEIDTVQNN